MKQHKYVGDNHMITTATRTCCVGFAEKSDLLLLFVQGMFEPYLKSFYIRSTDPTQIKILKVR